MHKGVHSKAEENSKGGLTELHGLTVRTASKIPDLTYLKKYL